MRPLFSCIFFLFFFALTSVSQTISRDKAVDEALKGIKMRERDLSVMSLSTDRFKLPLIDRLMDKPLQMPHFIDSIGNIFTDPKADEISILLGASRLMNNKPATPVIKSPSGEYPWKAKKELPVKLRESLDIIFAAFEGAKIEMDAAFANVDSFQIDTVKNFGLDYLVRDDGKNLSRHGKATLEELDEAELDLEKRTKRIFEIASKIDPAGISNASLLVLKSALMAESKLEGIAVQSGERAVVPDTIASGDIIFWCETNFGMVIIGGPGQTIYKKRFAVIIDLGGDDLYLISAGGAFAQVRFAVSIDLAGDDVYSSKRRFAFGSGGYGVGVLIDRTGNDVYRCDDLGIATGCFGTGFLIDRAGDDFYYGDVACQGHGFIGYGILMDSAGNDKYSARLFSQAFGYVGGFGMIVDKAGDDRYIAQGSPSDKIEFDGHNFSSSQGFGCGNRPDWSGGIGLLLDRCGNDMYSSDIFGQGASYWFSFGGLWDSAGDDVYNAFQYSQGSATFNSCAIILDATGNDNYISHSFSQGCGHDMAVGMLLDCGTGEDRYIVRDLSQGAGNANGVGIFIDEGGDDSYISKKDYSARGFGNFSRDFGSIGIMLDLFGKDDYSGKGEDGGWWSSGRYGIGIDFPAEMKEIK